MTANHRSKGQLPERATYHSGRASDHRVGGAEDLDPEERERRKRLYGFGKGAQRHTKAERPTRQLSTSERNKRRRERYHERRTDRMAAKRINAKPYTQQLDEAIARAKAGGK